MALLVLGAPMFRSGVFAVASACIALSCVSPVSARVGVTSVTDGQPIGQPPAEAERVLRVGIDVQANERVTTKADDRAHVVFLDGTSLTIGPNSILVIDRYVYDPDRKTGDIALSTTRGVFRFVGGAISKNSEVTVKTPAATIGIRGGIAQFTVADNGATSANFLYGDTMRVTSQGMTQVATRHGSQIEVPAGGQPKPPAIIPRGRMPGNHPLEKPLVGQPPTQGLVNQNLINQNLATQTQLIQSVTAIQPTTTTTATTTTTTSTTSSTPLPDRQRVASIDDAFDKSNFQKRNSGLTPRGATLVAAFRPEGKLDSQQQDLGAPLSRNQQTKAGPPKPAPVPKPPRVIAGLRNPIRNAVVQMNNKANIQQFQQQQQQQPRGKK